MTVNQLSVFIENKSGTLVKVLKLLKVHNIQLIASTITDTTDYGIYRILCSEPDKAYKILKDAGVAISLSEVFAIELDDVPGKAADAIDFLAKEDISISYLYAAQGKGRAHFPHGQYGEGPGGYRPQRPQGD